MGNHFPHEVAVHVVIGARLPHLGKHRLGYLPEFLLIKAQIPLRIVRLAAPFQYPLHIVDAPGLFPYNSLRNVLNRYTGRILQNVAGHLDGRPMVGDHLHNKIMG